MGFLDRLRARGDHTSTSDYDVAGISSSKEQKRIARFDEKHQVYHDLFIYPEDDFLSPTEEHLKMADGIVVVDKDDFGTNLLLKLKPMVDKPESIAPDEIQARKVWYKKMLARAEVGDLEGQYRHIWSIFTILEDYFVFKSLRYQGPKKAFQYLEKYDPQTFLLFKEALFNMNSLEPLEKLIAHIIN